MEKLDFVVYIANKKEIVVTQGTPCNKLYVLLEGKLRTDIIDGLGNEVMIEYIIAPRTFATPHLFSSDNTLPATFTALEDSVILMATKDSTFKVISQDPQVLHNFLCIAGNCNICTVSRLKPLSRKTVRERFIVYLFLYYMNFSKAALFKISTRFPSIVISPSLIILLISFDKAGRDTFRYSASWDCVCVISTIRESFFLCSNR